MFCARAEIGRFFLLEDGWLYGYHSLAVPLIDQLVRTLRGENVFLVSVIVSKAYLDSSRTSKEVVVECLTVMAGEPRPTNLRWYLLSRVRIAFDFISLSMILFVSEDTDKISCLEMCRSDSCCESFLVGSLVQYVELWEHTDWKNLPPPTPRMPTIVSVDQRLYRERFFSNEYQ